MSGQVTRNAGCRHRGQELEGTLRLHEFMREAEDLQSWLASWKQVARGGDSFGEDHAHVLVRGQGQGRYGGGGGRCWMAGASPTGLDGEGIGESWNMPFGVELCCHRTFTTLHCH